MHGGNGIYMNIDDASLKNLETVNTYEGTHDIHGDTWKSTNWYTSIFKC